MIPEFTNNGLLPPGEHATTWHELNERFATTPHRRQLLDTFRRACTDLTAAGCRRVWLNGSFVTSKPHPDDYDAVWDPDGVDFESLAAVFFDVRWPRQPMHEILGGDFFPNITEGNTNQPFVTFFTTDPDTGTRKGIVTIDLTENPP